MKRRPFLQKISLLSSVAVALPLTSFGKDLPFRAPRLKFITASDGHFGQPDTDYTSSHNNLMNAINKEENVDFVVFNGDLIHDEPAFMPQVKTFYDKLNSPYYVSRGNHDKVSSQVWEEIWGTKEDHAFQTKDGSGVILLSASNEEGEYLCGNVDFLKSKLDSFTSLSHVFVFIHISQKEWTRHGIDCSELINLIAQYPNVKATFHGHDHDVDGIMLDQKKPYLWSGHFGGSWGNPFPSYRVCEISEEGKTITYLKSVKEGTVLNAHSL